ncbi:MAG: hypothetical protein ACLPYZ_13280 [Limisphaerales bacterium]
MKNPSSKSNPRSVLRAALWGGLLFAGFSAAMMTVCYIRGSKGDLLGPEALIGIPTAIIFHVLHLHGTIIDDWVSHVSNIDVNSVGFDYLVSGIEFSIVNGLLGAFLFAVVARFRQFIVKKGNHENQTAGIE